MVPTRRQIANFVSRTLKPVVNGGKSDFSYADLFKWVKSNQATPDDVHAPFVLADFIEYNDKIPTASVIRISLSTKQLIKNVMHNDHICADATYKLIWQGKCQLFYPSVN